MRKIFAVMYREYKIRTTSMTWVFYDLALPLFYLLVFGIGLNKAFPAGVEIGGEAVDYNSFFLAGVLSMSAFGISINTSYGFFVDRDNGIFYEFLSYPMTRGEFLMGKILFNGVITCVQGLMTVLLGIFALGISIRPLAIPILVGVNMIGTAGWFFFLSIFALRIRRNDTYNALLNLLYFVLMFASSLFFPLDNSPAWLQAVALVNPLTWHTDVLRFLSLGAGSSPGWKIAAFLLFALLSFIEGIRSLKKSAG